MKKQNKVTAADERALYFALMGEEPCGECEETLSKEEQLESCNEAFWVCNDMLHNAIEKNDQDDARRLRRQLQEIKEERRRLLAS